MNLADYRKLIPEREHQKACLALAEQARFKVMRLNTGVGTYKNKDGSDRYVNYGIKGFPDLFGWIPKKIRKFNHCIQEFATTAQPFFWEVKRQGKKPTKDQQAFLDSAIADGCWAGWGTAEVLEARLKESGYL